jgi:hypothetical protein
MFAVGETSLCAAVPSPAAGGISMTSEGVAQIANPFCNSPSYGFDTRRSTNG